MELKSDWPIAEKAARRLAGHANAARGETVLWIIGLDERRGVVRIDQSKFAEWHAQVCRQFEGIAPTLRELAVPTVDGIVMALVIDTSRAPYVVSNPKYGSSQGGSVEFEVPWREGTSVRSARREDLLRLLAPLQTLPVVEVLNGWCSVSHEEGVSASYRNQVPPVQHEPHLNWDFNFDLYVTPRTTERLVFPNHKTTFSFRVGGDSHEALAARTRLAARYRFSTQGSSLDSHTIINSGSEVIVDGPGVVEVHAHLAEKPRAISNGNVEIRLVLVPSGSDVGLTLTLGLKPAESEKNRTFWRL